MLRTDLKCTFCNCWRDVISDYEMWRHWCQACGLWYMQYFVLLAEELMLEKKLNFCTKFWEKPYAASWNGWKQMYSELWIEGKCWYLALIVSSNKAFIIYMINRIIYVQIRFSFMILSTLEGNLNAPHSWFITEAEDLWALPCSHKCWEFKYCLSTIEGQRWLIIDDVTQSLYHVSICDISQQMSCYRSAGGYSNRSLAICLPRWEYWKYWILTLM